MTARIPHDLLSVFAALLLSFGFLQPAPVSAQQADTSSAHKVERKPIDPDVPYVPTPRKVVNRMLKMADVGPDDVLYDLGSGDGRIVIAAAEKYGTRGVGIEIDPERVKEARKNAKAAGVEHLVEFRQMDLFEADLSEATAVTLYLLSSVNMKLRPKLFRELEAGTPVVSHSFDMGDWEYEKVVNVDGHALFLWHIPEEIPAHLKE